MTDKNFKFSQKIYQWLSGIAPTYRGVLPSGITPDGAYFRFDGGIDNFADNFILAVSIYAPNTTSYSTCIQLADKLESAIGDGGITLRDSSMIIHIAKGTPFYQDKPDEDLTIRAGYVNLEVSVYAVSAKSKYRISFTDDISHSLSTAWYDVGEKITLPSTVKYDYLQPYLEGWSDGINTYPVGYVFSTPEHNVDFTAVWADIKTWTISFMANGKLVDIRTYDYLHRNIVTPPVPEVYGYTAMWEPFDIFAMSGDFTVTAIYTPHPELLLSGEYTADHRIQTLRRSAKKS